MGIIDILKYGLGSFMELVGLKREQAQRENTPEMQANAKAALEAKVIDEARNEIAEGDEDAIRRGLS